jgi:hypothetical protein
MKPSLEEYLKEWEAKPLTKLDYDSMTDSEHCYYDSGTRDGYGIACAYILNQYKEDIMKHNPADEQDGGLKDKLWILVVIIAVYIAGFLLGWG